MPPRDFWRLAHNIERLAQLKLDLHDTLGRLLTQCYEMARLDDQSCSEYWNSEGRYWEQQYHEAIKLTDQMLNLAAMGKVPATQQINDQRTVMIGNINAGGDVIISTVQDSSGVAAGKDLKQDIGE